MDGANIALPSSLTRPVNMIGYVCGCLGNAPFEEGWLTVMKQGGREQAFIPSGNLLGAAFRADVSNFMSRDHLSSVAFVSHK